MSNQQYRHCGRKLTPVELVELLTDQHCAMADDPVMLWMSMSLEDMADVVERAIRCECGYSTPADRLVLAYAAAHAFSAGLDKGVV